MFAQDSNRARSARRPSRNNPNDNSQQAQASNGGQRRRNGKRKSPAKNDGPRVEPILIAARRPDAPIVASRPRRTIAASAQPRSVESFSRQPAPELPSRLSSPTKRREVRIVEVKEITLGAVERKAEQLLERFLRADGRGVISRIAIDLQNHQIEIPGTPEYQIQLLEHSDDRIVEAALNRLEALFDQGDLSKEPLLERRLRRIEDDSDAPALSKHAVRLLQKFRGL